MAVTYYVALPFLRTEEGVAPGEAQEMPNERPRSDGPSRCRGILPTEARLRLSGAAIRTWEISTTPQF
jgi:hypothetical protein